MDWELNLVGSQSKPKVGEHVSANTKLLSVARNGPMLMLCGYVLTECIDNLKFLQESDNCEIAQ